MAANFPQTRKNLYFELTKCNNKQINVKDTNYSSTKNKVKGQSQGHRTVLSHIQVQG